MLFRSSRCSLWLIGVLLGGMPALAEPPLVVAGSTTFAARLMEPYRELIVQRSGVAMTVMPNKSINGVMAVLERRADLAMISAPVEAETQILRLVNPRLPFADLQSFEVARTAVAFVVHPDNPIKRLSLDEIRRILSGQIVNWRALSGPDLPIKPVMVREGGGVTLSVQVQLLAGQSVTAAGAVRVDTPRKVVKVVAQEPGALGITQPQLAAEIGLPRLETDGPVEQVLNLVSLGPPTARARRVIDVTRIVAVERLF
jgi:phosphate transport system substrate-binding protein